MEDVLAWMILTEAAAVCGASTRELAEAAAGAGSAEGLLTEDTDALRARGFSEAGIGALRRVTDHEVGRLRARIRRCEQLAIDVVAFSSAEYPPLLRQIHDPPLVLYKRGSCHRAESPAVAIVGSRRASRYGLRVSGRLAERLALSGVTVVSGLARGIDCAAHEAAVSRGASVAVVAGGLDHVDASHRRRLADRIAGEGGILSESPPGTVPLPRLFPVRNRLITGMSRVVIIVEATERSGSLISARLAGEQGREVFAVPGAIDSPVSVGTNRLIRDGATPLLELESVLTACGFDRPVSEPVPRAPKSARDKAFPGAEAAAVLAAIDPSGSSAEELAEAIGLDGARIMEFLTALELGEFVERLPGGRFVAGQSLYLGTGAKTEDGKRPIKRQRAGDRGGV